MLCNKTHITEMINDLADVSNSIWIWNGFLLTIKSRRSFPHTPMYNWLMIPWGFDIQSGLTNRDKMCLLTCCVVEIHLSLLIWDTCIHFWPTSMIKMFWLYSRMAQLSSLCWSLGIDSSECSPTTGWFKHATCSSRETRIASWTQTK